MIPTKGRRAPPAFQEYAASRLADRAFKAMSALERGVFYSMRLECWINGSVPSSKRDLARVLGLDISDVEQGLTKRVLAHFEEHHEADDGHMLLCPELENYREELDRRRQRQSEGGKQTAATINKRRQAERQADGSPDSLPDSSLDKNSADQKSKDQSLVSGLIPEEHREFLADYEGPAPFEVGKSAGRGLQGRSGCDTVPQKKSEWSEASSRATS